ncbi:MAG: DUF1883 domain-containing protein [Flavobacteriales bacterium]
MKFLHQQYQAKKKEIIEVEIDQPTKVKFMSGMDFKKYKLGKTHKYFGGLFEESPVRFVLPYDSVWNVVVEKGSWKSPLDVKANSRVLVPNRKALSSIASDAPDHVRKAIQSEVEDEPATVQSGEDQD